MRHICVSELTIIGSDNGLSPGQRQAIIWTNAGILLIRTSGTNCSDIFIEIDVFSFKKMHLKMSSGKWRPFCLGLNVLKPSALITHRHLHVQSMLNPHRPRSDGFTICVAEPEHHFLILLELFPILNSSVTNPITAIVYAGMEKT